MTDGDSAVRGDQHIFCKVDMITHHQISTREDPYTRIKDYLFADLGPEKKTKVSTFECIDKSKSREQENEPRECLNCYH